MNHHANPNFWKAYAGLPKRVRHAADESYQLLKIDARHPSLQFKKVGRFWSARVSLNYRAVAVQRDADYVWFWIGTHDEYDRLIRQA